MSLIKAARLEAERIEPDAHASAHSQAVKEYRHAVDDRAQA
jgi:hypothetical protein